MDRIDGPIAVVAPCGAYDPDRLATGVQAARAAGFDVQLLPDLLQPERYLAAPDAVRLAHLQAALSDPHWSAVWVARGGYGMTRLLDRVDWDAVQAKPVLGFSDVTALHSVLLNRGLGPAIHAPVLHSIPVTDAPSLAHLWQLLRGQDTAPLCGESWTPGTVEAPVVGGNLCLLAATCGTSAQLDTRGAILLLEDVGEPAYRIDRMLQQIANAGLLQGLAGVAVGEFKDCRVPEGAAWTMEDVLRSHLEPLGVPVVAKLPIGHGARNWAIPLGIPARLGADALELL